MGLYEANIEYLTSHYPSLLSIVDRHDLEPEYTVTPCTTRYEEPNLFFTSGTDLSYNLHSKYNALHEAQRWVNSLRNRLAEVKCLLVIGCGLGYYLEEIIKNTEIPNIYVYEPSVKIFQSWLTSRDISVALSDPRVRGFAVGQDEFVAFRLAEEISSNVYDSFDCISPPIYQKIFPDFIEDFEKKIRERILLQIANFHTLELNQNTWLGSVLNNLPHVISNESIAPLKDKCKDTKLKAIVVGSGPSLKKDIHYLKKLKDHCLIIAAGSSIQVLKHYGIVPHFVVSMDGRPENFNVFKNVDTSDVPLMFCPQLYYEITDCYQSDAYHFLFLNDQIIPYLTEMEDIPEFISTATVTGLAIQIAVFMGINEIILMGQDLSFTDGQYYAPGANHISEDDKFKAISEADMTVLNVEGTYNQTKANMQVLLDDLQILIQILKLSGVSILNTSKKGAVIKGTEWISMDDLYPELIQCPKHQFTLSSFFTSLDSELTKQRMERVIKKMKTLTSSIDDVEMKCRRLKRELMDLASELSFSNDSHVFKKLKKVDKLWTYVTEQDIFTRFYSYSLRHGINVFMRYVPEIAETNDLKRKGELIVEHMGTLVSKIIEFTPELKKIFNTAINRLNQHVIRRENE